MQKKDLQVDTSNWPSDRGNKYGYPSKRYMSSRPELVIRLLHRNGVLLGSNVSPFLKTDSITNNARGQTYSSLLWPREMLNSLAPPPPRAPIYIYNRAY